VALLRSQGEFEAAGRAREELLVPKLKNLITGLCRQQDAPTIARRYNNSREENPSPSIDGARIREDGDDGPLISLPIGAPPGSRPLRTGQWERLQLTICLPPAVASSDQQLVCSPSCSSIERALKASRFRCYLAGSLKYFRPLEASIPARPGKVLCISG
jgi:hypothetical protein